MGKLTWLILAFVLLALLLRVDFVFYIVYVLLAIYGWSRWAPGHAIRQLAITRSFADHAFLGEKIDVTLTIDNRGRFRLPWLHLSETIPLGIQVATNQTDLAVSLRGREQLVLHYQVQAYRRGYYRLGPLRLRLGDLFGFAELDGRLPASFLTIYPRITPVERLGLPSRLPFGTVASTHRLFEDPARSMGVRPYRQGDTLRRINWKVSASKEELLVKTLEPAISLETTILLNLDLNDYDEREWRHSTEWAVEIAASLAAHLVDRRQAVGLVTNGADPLRARDGAEDGLRFDEESGRLLMRTEVPRQTEWKLGHPLGPGAAHMPPPIPTRGGRSHLMKVLELLARIEAADTAHFPSWLPGATVGLNWGVTLLVITPDGSLAVCQALHSLVRAGFNPVLAVVERRSPFGQIQERARRLGFSAMLLADRGDFQPVAAGRP